MVDINLILDFLANKDVQKYAKEFHESKNSQPEESLNVFKMSSDMYQRENFHSDIIKTFLDPTEKHKEGYTFLFAFIDFINNNFGEKIKKSNYRSAVVEREKGKIDILIKSEERKHCIIIENKSNNAPDTWNQLPNYYKAMSEEDYTVDAIVYLPLDPDKRPVTSTWTKDVESLLCIVPVYTKNDTKNLVSGWIEPCTLKAKNLDCISILRQFGELLKTLSNNNMDDKNFEDFYNFLFQNQNWKTAISVKKMVDDLPTYMANRLNEKLKELSMEDAKVWKWKPPHCGVLFFKGDAEYKIDIWSSLDGYKISVFSQDDAGHHTDWAEGFSSLTSFSCNPDKTAFIKEEFNFYDENKVVECVKPIIKEIRKYLSKNQ